LVVDHCARIVSGPFDDEDSDQVFAPVANPEIFPTSVSLVLPSFVSMLDCAASQVLSGRVPNANTPFPTLTLFTLWITIAFKSARSWPAGIASVALLPASSRSVAPEASARGEVAVRSGE